MSALDRWHEEKQSAWVYRGLARFEREPRRAHMFLALSEAAETQAAILESDVRGAGGEMPPFAPELRARLGLLLARRLGVARVRPMLVALKVRGLSVYDAPPLDAGGHPMPRSLEQIGARHRRAGTGGTLRAAVFGVSDGLVSNTSLILGIAGAGAEPRVILLAGAAGLLAGALSMAAGEYLSVRSQRELFELQIAEEREELARYPEEEAEELALIYEARGVPLDKARAMTLEMVKDPVRALDTLAREELGLNPDDLGSPWGAAISSFLAFAGGALLPLVPFLVPALERRVEAACLLAAAALFAVGASLSLFSGRGALLGGLRMLGIGAGAGAATWLIGSWLGVSLS